MGVRLNSINEIAACLCEALPYNEGQGLGGTWQVVLRVSMGLVPKPKLPLIQASFKRPFRAMLGYSVFGLPSTNHAMLKLKDSLDSFMDQQETTTRARKNSKPETELSSFCGKAGLFTTAISGFLNTLTQQSPVSTRASSTRCVRCF